MFISRLPIRRAQAEPEPVGLQQLPLWRPNVAHGPDAAAKVGARSSERTAIGDPAGMSELAQLLLATLASALSSRLRLLLTKSANEPSNPDLTFASPQQQGVLPVLLG